MHIPRKTRAIELLIGYLNTIKSKLILRKYIESRFAPLTSQRFKQLHCCNHSKYVHCFYSSIEKKQRVRPNRAYVPKKKNKQTINYVYRATITIPITDPLPSLTTSYTLYKYFKLYDHYIATEKNKIGTQVVRNVCVCLFLSSYYFSVCLLRMCWVSINPHSLPVCIINVYTTGSWVFSSQCIKGSMANTRMGCRSNTELEKSMNMARMADIYLKIYVYYTMLILKLVYLYEWGFKSHFASILSM